MDGSNGKHLQDLGKPREYFSKTSWMTIRTTILQAKFNCNTEQKTLQTNLKKIKWSNIMPYFIPVRKNMHDNYQGVSRLHDDIDRLFGGNMFPGHWMRQNMPERVAEQPDITPMLDVTANEEAYFVHIELPGVSPEDVNIKVADNVLTISGEKKNEVREGVRVFVQERGYGTFSRALSLPEDADAERIRAFAKDGVLMVEIPRRKPEEVRTRTIEVQRG